MDAFALPLLATMVVVLVSATTYLTVRDFGREKKIEEAEKEAKGLAHPKAVTRQFRHRFWWLGFRS